MNTPTPDRKVLEEQWRQRLNNLKLRLQFARNYMLEARRDFSTGEISLDVERFAYTAALRSETSALVEYDRVLRIYADLMARDIIPEEPEPATDFCADPE